MAASIASLIDSLPNRDDKIEALGDLQALLGSVPISSLASVVANVSFNCVFDCLTTENSEQLELCCDVLKKLLTSLPPNVLLTQFQEELCAGLTHDEPTVRKLCLSQISRFGSEGVGELVQYENILVQVVTTLADRVLDVSKTAGDILIMIGCSESPEDLTVLFHGQVMSTLQEVLSTNDTIRFRVYEVLASISKQTPNGLQKTAESGLLQQFINELYKDDILLQLNCLELLSDLALSSHGLLYLDQQGVLSRLENMMQATESDPLAGFLIPGLVKFFGCVARLHPKEVCTGNRVFISTVFNNLSSPESESMHSLAVQTLGFIGSSVEGKLALEKLGARMDAGVRCIGKALKDSQPDLKVIILQALNTLLKLRVPDQTSELLKLTEYWFCQLGTRTFDYLLTLAERPFPDIRIAVLSVFEALSSQPWGQHLMNDQPGFREYLLNRSTESMKEGKEAKFEIISSLANSPTAGEIFGQPYMVQLKVYCSQGPFFLRVQSEVATEGD